jgi:ABC-type glycerol-3-phosphate transport system permease component
VTLPRRSLRAGCLAILVAFAAMPLYWMLVISLKGEPNPLGSGDPWWPASPTLAHYAGVVRSPLVARWMLNTAVVTGATLLVSLVSSLLAAYALAYLDVPSAAASSSPCSPPTWSRRESYSSRWCGR